MLNQKIFLAIFIFLICCGPSNAKVLFTDDFEDNNLGDEPSNWEHLDFAVISLESLCFFLF